MKSLDKAINFVDSEEEDIKKMDKIYDEAAKAVNMVNTQIKKLKQFEQKLRKFEYGNLQAEYMKVAYQKLQDAIEDVFDALHRGKP